MVHRQCSGQHQMRALTWAWVRAAQGDGDMAEQGRDGFLPRLPLGHQICVNTGPQQRDCLSVRVCTAPIANAIIGIKVNESRNDRNP